MNRSDPDDPPTHPHAFDRQYWEQHWSDPSAIAAADGTPPNPYLAEAVRGRTPATALDAGCGTGTEAIRLARDGWTVTGADISAGALATAAERAARAGVAERITWVEADLTTWEPDARWDLVVTHYAHPEIAPSAFVERLAGWVAPGGTLLVVTHRHDPSGAEHPPEATADAIELASRLDPTVWRIDAAEPRHRPHPVGGDRPPLRDVVVRATRTRSAESA